MFRILIIEDVEDTLRQLEAYISEYFFMLEGEAVTEIHRAMSVAEAHKLLRAAFEEDRPYHVVVLDFNLPEHLGRPAQVDESVCSMIRTLMPSTIVAHITAYKDDELVKEHWRINHQEVISKAVILSKVNSEYPIKLVEYLKKIYHSDRLEEQINKIFFADAKVSLVTDGTRRGRDADCSLAHELAELSRDIAAHWFELDESVRTRVKQVFRVDTSGTQIVVNLL